jgi:hypothetical protein
MTCDDLRQRYREMLGAAVDDLRRDEWSGHLHECRACGDWYLEQQVRDRGFDPKTFPCVHIAYHVTYECSQHDSAWDCPDRVLVYDERLEEYGLPIRDGGSSSIGIDFCPWCGLELNKVIQSRHHRPWIARGSECGDRGALEEW